MTHEALDVLDGDRPSGRRGRWARVGVRGRSTLAATVVVSLALIAGSLALLVLLERALTESIDSVVVDRARSLATEIEVQQPSPTLPEGAAALREAVAATARPGVVVQILSPAGEIIAESGDIDGEQPLANPAREGGRFVRTDGVVPVDDENLFRIISLGVSRNGGVYTVVAAQSLAGVSVGVGSVAVILLVGVPILALLVAAATYVFVGRALRPVEQMRATAAKIGASDLSHRVPVPESSDVVGRLAVTMNRMLDRLQSSQVAQRRFVSDASHELRSPIASLRALAEVSLAHPDDAELPRVAGGVLDETLRLERLVGDLLLLARADERGLRGANDVVDLDEILRAEVVRLRTTTGLRVEADAVAVQVPGSGAQLAQLVRNLVDNAARHARGTVGLTLRRQGSLAVLEVSDDGRGIPPQDRERIFDRFVRLDESRQRADGGTGLGLAIVREIARAHQGSVVVAGDPDRTVFRVTLPAGGA